MGEKVRRYAQDTKVPVGQTRDELERLLRKAGAGQVFAGFDNDNAQIVVGFSLERRQYKFRVSTSRPTRRCEPEQIEREAWRSLLLLVKAKLEYVASGASTYESEFLAHLVLPSGATVADEVAPVIDEMYATGQVRQLLAG